MTRDEATRLVRDSGPIGEAYKPYDESLVDALSALGILKLDEPKSAEKRFCEVIQGLAPFQRTAAELLSAIDAVGLRLVEK